MIIHDIFDKYYKEDCSTLKEWCSKIYETYFGNCFSIVDSLYEKIKLTSDGFTHVKLSDSELEMILTELPIKLYHASEALNMLRLEHDMIKMKRIEVKNAITQELKENNVDKSKIDSLVSSRLVEHDVLMKAYDAVIQRADNERSACRELIMSSKKIWDSRRSAEQTNPVSEVSTDLPDYNDIAKNQYIR